ncbi:MAG: hypothetical protein ACRCWJ_04190 [Casimicrobium sp.]
MKKFLLVSLVACAIAPVYAASSSDGVCIKNGAQIPRHEKSCKKDGGKWIPNGATEKATAKNSKAAKNTDAVSGNAASTTSVPVNVMKIKK